MVIGGMGGVIPPGWARQDGFVAREGGHRRQAPIGLHEGELHTFLQAIIEAGLEVIDVPVQAVISDLLTAPNL